MGGFGILSLKHHYCCFSICSCIGSDYHLLHVKQAGLNAGMKLPFVLFFALSCWKYNFGKMKCFMVVFLTLGLAFVLGLLNIIPFYFIFVGCSNQYLSQN